MTDKELKTPELETPEPEMGEAENRVGFEVSVVGDIIAALDSENINAVREIVAPLHYSDAADLLEQLNAEQRRLLLEYAQDILDPEFLAEIDETVRDEVIEHMKKQYVCNK